MGAGTQTPKNRRNRTTGRRDAKHGGKYMAAHPAAPDRFSSQTVEAYAFPDAIEESKDLRKIL